MPRTIISEAIQETATCQLRAEKPRDWRARYHVSDLSGAIRSAARYARAAGKDAFVYPSNGYGAFCYRVTEKTSDIVSRISNDSNYAFRVTPTAEIRKVAIA